MAAATITLGGSLCSSSVHKIASCIADVRIESPTIEGLSIETSQSTSKRSSFGIPKDLTKEEFRASLVVLLNKLLLSSSSGSVLPLKILKVLDDSKADETFDFGEIVVDVNEWERIVLDNSRASLIGLCCLIDHKATALSQIVDSVAALTCEATKSDVTSFQSLISGDVLGNKDAIAVARVLNGLLKGSEAVGKFEILEIVEVPRSHGKFRDVVKRLHSNTRVQLNTTTVYSSRDSGVGEAFEITLCALSRSLKTLGECSFLRAKLCYESIGNKNLRKGLSQLFEKCCVKYDKLKKGYNLVEKDYCKFAHELNESLGIVWSIVYFEAAAAFFALAGGELFVKKTNVGAENEEPETDDKRNKEKNNAVLGKGTGKIIQFIKDRLVTCSGRDQMELLEQWMEQIANLFNPEGDCLDSWLEKLKEIVQSNENSFKLPKGTRVFGKEEMLVREKAFSVVQNVFKRHGATALDTPVFELRETLLGKYGEDSKLIYDIADQGGELCSLRYDLTVPFARYVAMNGFQPFKRYQIETVYRRDNVSKGRFREFYQCDYDIAGSYERMEPDFEVVKILTELLDELEIGDYEVRVNHQKLLNGMLEICGVPPEKFATICSSMAKLDKRSFEQVKKEMVEVKGLSSEIADRIGKLVGEKGAPMELLSKLRQEGSVFLANEQLKDALDDLSILFEALESSKCIHRIVFDLSLARGLDYYTGVIFEAVCIGAEVGSIGAGGRYDNLIGKFGTTKESDKQPKQVPAVGVSLGIERVLVILEDQRQKEMENKLQWLPDDVILQVILRSPVKSIGRWCSMSKYWKSVVCGEEFKGRFFTLSKNKLPELLCVLSTDDEYHLRNYCDLSFVSVNPEKELMISTKESIRIDLKFCKAHYIRGLICLQKGQWVVVCNPCTKKVMDLPYLSIKAARCYFGCEKDDDVYKLLFVKIADDYDSVEEEEYQVYKLGSGEQDVKEITCQYPHCTYDVDECLYVCKEGSLFYQAHNREKKRVVMEFELKSEKFNPPIELPEEIFGEDYEQYTDMDLANYKGKIALVLTDPNCSNGFGKRVFMWVWNGREWSNESFHIKVGPENLFGWGNYRFKGVSAKGEFVFALNCVQNGSVNVLLYDLETKNLRKVRVRGVIAEGYADWAVDRVDTFLDHVESLFLSL